MSRLYLIRHGKPASTWGEADPDPGLDETGWAQARAARDWLLSRPRDERPTRVVSSPMRRCRDTAAPTAEALGVTVEIDPRVGEIETPRALAPEQRRGWLQDAFQGEWRQIVGDIDYDAWRDEIIASLAGRGSTAVFSHYVAINAAVSRLIGDPRVLVFRPDHTSITVLDTDGVSVRLVAKGAEAETGVL